MIQSRNRIAHGTALSVLFVSVRVNNGYKDTRSFLTVYSITFRFYVKKSVGKSIRVREREKANVCGEQSAKDSRKLITWKRSGVASVQKQTPSAYKFVWDSARNPVALAHVEIKIKEKEGKWREKHGEGNMGMKYKSVRERSIAVAANFPNFVNKLPETKILKRIVKVLTSSRTLAIYPFLPSFADCVYLFSNPRENNFLHYNLSPPRSLLISLLFFSRRASYAYHIDTTR